MRGSTWVERGPDGRAYYVKRKPELPSVRQTIAEAIHDIRQRNPFFNNESTTNTAPSAPQPTADALQPKSHSKRKSQPRPQSEMAGRERALTQPTHVQPSPQNHNSSQPQYYHFAGLPPLAPPFSNHANNLPIAQPPNNMAVVSTHLPHYTTPHPHMYPYVPAGSQALVTQASVLHSNNVQPLERLRFPQNAQPTSSAQVGMTPALPNPDGTRPKCSSCGRLRSPRYQWRHRIAPGQLPPPNICRRCRKEATDSEDESTDGHSGSPHRSQSRDRRGSRHKTSKPRSTIRSRSGLGRGPVDFDYYADQALSETSDPESIEYERPSRRSSCRRRAQPPSMEFIRYVDLPTRPRGRKQMTVYVEDYRSSQDASEEDNTNVRYVEHPARHRVMSRPVTPLTRALKQQPSSPAVRSHIIIERREPLVIDNAPRTIKHVVSHARLRPGTPRFVNESSSSDNRYHIDEDYVVMRHTTHPYASEDDREPRARVRSGSRGRRRSRSDGRSSIDEDAGSARRGSSLARAPSLSDHRRRRSSSLAYVDSVELDKHESRNHDRHELYSDRRRRKGSVPEGYRTIEKEEEEALIDDYDWYDKNGMRVRVREI